MDSKSVSDHTNDLQQELDRLKKNPSIKVPTILELAEMEIDRLNETMLSMKASEATVHTDEDGLMMIEHISNEFGLHNVSSMEYLRYKLRDELKVLVWRFDPPHFHIARFILTVIRHLEQKISREVMSWTYYIGGSSSQEPIQASPDDYESSGSVTPAEEQGSGSSPLSDDTLSPKSLEWCIDVAIKAKMQSDPKEFCVDRVIDLLQRQSEMFCVNVDDEDVRKLVVQKCKDAIETRNKKLADQGKSGSKKTRYSVLHASFAAVGGLQS